MWPLQVLKYSYSHQMITSTHPRGNKRVLEKSKFYCLRRPPHRESTPSNAHSNDTTCPIRLQKNT